MECLVSTQRSNPKAVSKIRAGAPIANITTKNSVYATQEALASNATVMHKSESKFRTSGSIRGTISVIVNIGVDTDIDTISSVIAGAFGSTDTNLIQDILNLFLEEGKANGTITESMSDSEITKLFLDYLESSGFATSTSSTKERLHGSGSIRFIDVEDVEVSLPIPAILSQLPVGLLGNWANNILGSTNNIYIKARTPRVDPYFSASDEDGTSYGGALSRKEKNGKIVAKAKGGVIACRARVSGKSKLTNTHVDKIGGHVEQINKLRDFSATQKFYPIKDINTEKNNVSFVDETLNNSGIYRSVDEGLFTGNYTKSFKVSSLISDEFRSFIQPSSIYSEGNFNYQCELTPPQIKPIENFLFIRAAAPMSVLESDIPPEYRIHNIKWTDPDGNIISTYKDIKIRGDSQFDREDENYNFATYVTEPIINNAKRYNWDTYEKLPSFSGVSGYKLNMDFEVTCFHKPFSPEFNKGYEDGCSLDFVITGDNDYIGLDGSPLSTQTQGFDFTPNNSIRISNIEIAASGSKGPLVEDYMPLYSLPPTESLRSSRKIYPTEVMLEDYVTDIYPEVKTVWRSSPDRGVYSFNQSPLDKKGMAKALRDFQSERYIELMSSSVADSGKLKVKFEHEPPVFVKEPSNGEWGLGGKNEGSRLNTAKVELIQGPDEFFKVDSIELHVRARKAIGSRDYVLDVVGFTDDGLLNVSSAAGGFLQNDDAGAGSIPITSGFKQSNYLTSSAESFSSREGFFENTTTANDGGDHYLLSTAPVVNSTVLKNYVIPLKIYRSTDKFGLQDDYSGSNNFESLILDIFPLPTGAVIARVDLEVKYIPSNAITMHTVGHGPQEVSRRSASLQLNKMGSNDHRLNCIWTEQPLSLIENIPHAYTSAETLKTNYARRWRGVDGGIKSGPFQADQFDLAFENPPLYYPFTAGHYLFNDVDGNTIYSDQNPEISYTGIYNNTLSDNFVKNVGMRFDTDKLFATQDREYKTIDWTTEGHELHGQIMDGFDNAIRVDQASKNINYGDIHASEGFSVFARFSPDINVSGTDYNLFNSGVLVSKWDSGKDLEFTLGYQDGRLTGKARDENGNIITVQDSLSYTDYSYPLATVLAYNDKQSGKLRLYADNEIASGEFNSLRASSSPFVMYSGDSNLVVGHSSGSGVGMSAFVTEFGIAQSNPSGTLIVPSGANITRQESNIGRFFDSFRSKFWNVGETYKDERFKIWDFINERASEWHIGAFKFCEFGASYDTLSNRIGSDFILHEHQTDGKTYGSICDSPLPNNVIASGLSYHTQIENDFLRLHLDDISNKFIAAAPRLVKTLPRGYDPATDAIAVDTIVEHDTTGDIQWPDGNVGPKVIVSLYTKRKETDLFDTTNWGLINRDYHHIGPEDCWRKLTSKFTVGTITDKTTEPWSNFNRDQLVKETDHHLYSNDINDMFLQYDLAYPSGNFKSQIRMHSAEVRLEDALHLKDVLYVDDFILYTSGEPKAFEQMNLFCQEPIYSTVTEMNIFASGGTMPHISGGMNLYSSGIGELSAWPMSLFTTTPIGFASSSHVQPGMTLHTNGIEDFFSNNGGNFGSLGLEYEDNKTNDVMFGAVGDGGTSSTIMALYAKNDEEFSGPHSLAQAPLFVRAMDEFGKDHNNSNSSFNIYTHGKSAYYWRDEIRGITKNTIAQTTNLFVKTDDIDQTSSGNMNFYTSSIDPSIFYATGSMPLYTVNINPINNAQDYLVSFTWDGTNTGSSIVIDDNYRLALDADDEIRGVVTMCYGDCDNNGTCIEQQLITHDTLWLDTQCIPGGVIRPINVYNNDQTIGYNTVEAGYHNNYYGVRKFTNLIPSQPYDILIGSKSAQAGVLEVPREITEIGYGSTNEVDYSGVKLVAPDGKRNIFDEFAYSVDIAGDLMAVGVPHLDLEDNGEPIRDAGSVFVYRRNPQPSGYDWSTQDDQARWSLEAQLAMPSGFRLDRYQSRRVEISEQIGDKIKVVGYANQKDWFNGQKGRQLGHSVAVSSHNGREIIVAGGPGGIWERTFDDLNPDPVKVILFLFTDEFTPVKPWPRSPRVREHDDWTTIKGDITERDTYFRYFCDPPVEFDVQIVILEGILGTSIEPSDDFEDDILPVPDFIHKRQIGRMGGFATIEEYNTAKSELINEIIDIYQELFPLDPSIINNGLPPIVGFDVDNSLSYGPSALGSELPDRIKGGVLGGFQTWLSDYAYNNGLVNYKGEAARPYFYTTVTADEGWMNHASAILKRALDRENLYEGGAVTLFANNLGTFTEGLSEFNTPAPSGGAAYVFEKLDYGWDLTQELLSPTTTSNHYVDRYAHDVAISKEGNVIVIGSPFINEAVQVLEYNPYYDSSFYVEFRDWLRFEGSKDTSYGELYQSARTLDNRLSGATTPEQYEAVLKDVFANTLSPSGRFEFRLYHNQYDAGEDDDERQYSPRRIYTYEEAGGGHNWNWLANDHIPTARIGYSVDVNNDGTTVVIGCPTDSLGARDESQFWYKPGPTSTDTAQWFSNVNAGSVRILEGRKYYPHDTVMQYGIFGNLHRTLSEADKDTALFNHFGPTFNSSLNSDYTPVKYLESEFTDPEIPENVGTLMIVTPEINSLSEEVLKNIKDWLALGDRNLVLVGDDPFYETDSKGNQGVYRRSNLILNSLLSQLDSRMRIEKADTRYESMVDQDTGLYNNIGASYVPQYGDDTPSPLHSFIHVGNIRGSGVADIRFHDETIYDDYTCAKTPEFSILQGLDQLPFKEPAGYEAVNDKCELPIQHGGDLRAHWTDECEKWTPRGIVLVSYERNIAFQYGTHQTPDWGCDVEQKFHEPAPRERYEPIPVLAARERLTKTEFIRGSADSVTQEPYVSGRRWIPKDTKKFVDSVDVSGVPHFCWTADSGNFISLNQNVYATQNSNSKFLEPNNPILEENNKTAILMAKSEILGSDRSVDEPIDDFVVAAREPLGKGTSEVHLISMLLPESSQILNLGDDRNGLFYMNLVDKDTAGQIGGGARIGQLGGFTGNDTFRTAYPKEGPGKGSDLGSFFDMRGNVVEENVDPLKINDAGRKYDVLWVANSRGRPSSREVTEMKKWLNGDTGRKLVITFGQETENQGGYDESPAFVERIRIAEYICEELGITMRPYFIASKSKYATLRDDTDFERRDGYSVILNPRGNDDLVFGKRGTISHVRIGDEDDDDEAAIIIPIPNEHIGIKTNNANPTLYTGNKIMEPRKIPVGTPFVRSGTAKVTFSVEPNKYYRMFFEEVSNFASERLPLGYIITNCDVSSEFHQRKGQLNVTPGANPEGRTSRISKWLTREIRSSPQIPTDLKIEVYKEEVNTSFVKPKPAVFFFQNKGENDGQWWVENYGPVEPGSRDVLRRSVILSIPENVTSIDLYVNADYHRDPMDSPPDLDTWRLLGVSGIEIDPPYDVFGGTYVNIMSYRDIIEPGTPDSIRTYVIDREISHPSHQYCPSDNCIEAFTFTPQAVIPDGTTTLSPTTTTATPEGGKDIADGPVVVAQEEYHQAPFIYGAERSRITVITDASMIQGINATKEDDKQTIAPDVIKLIESLYRTSPDTFGLFDNWEPGLSYTQTTKVISPEKNSPARLVASEENAGFNNLFGAYPQNRKSASAFGNDENLREVTEFQWIMPAEPLNHKSSSFVEKRVPPPADDSVEARDAARDEQRVKFSGIMSDYSCYSKFNVDINGERYYDTGMGQLPPKFMEDFGYDFLDFDHNKHLISGYPGDLFGYNVKIGEDNVIYIGSPFAPFSGETITPWDEVVENTPNGPLHNAKLGYYGGAGCVYKFEKTYDGLGPYSTIIPWTATGKIQPNSLSVGDAQTRRSDRFGSEIVIDADFMAISAPDHSDDSLLIRDFGDFVRKEFNDQFSIGTVETYDTGDTSLSQEIRDSGQVIENVGAVYTYERKIKDWGTKQQDWVFLQKVIPQGYNARYSQNHETEAFARSIAVSRTSRSDSDYSLVVGAPLHQYGSGVTSSLAPSGGALYYYDAMMRRPKPSFANPDTNIEGRIYGFLGDSLPETEKYFNFNFRNGNKFDHTTWTRGVVYASTEGEIFIEASGQDKNDKGYAIHRPYIEAIEGVYKHGVFEQNFIPLLSVGAPPKATGNMTLFAAQEGSNVYNTMSMFATSSDGIPNGEMNVFAQGVTPSSIAIPASNGLQGFNLYSLCSGVISGGDDGSISGLNLFVRGKL